ncbi:MAG: hypothetical protein R3356_03815, partial [Eudoraea sp.]|nr:hypothetical protein [Eudoraea sp.]
MRIILVLLGLSLVFSCKSEPKSAEKETKTEVSLMAGSDTLIYPEEKHFKSIRQITFGGDNAEAYWSFDDSMMIFQSNYE